MADFGVLSGAIQSVKFCADVLKNISDGKVQIESQALVMDAYKKLEGTYSALFEVREDLFRLQGEVQRLSQEATARRSWDERFDQYELVRTVGGAVVYRARAGLEHFACPACFNKKEVHPLQPGFNGYYSCRSCTAGYQIEALREVPGGSATSEYNPYSSF